MFCSKVFSPDSAVAADHDNELVQGATIYRDFCMRCHGSYLSKRPAEDYEDELALIGAVADKGCRISWGFRFGGKLNQGQIQAVSRYMLHVENTEEDVIPLPPAPKVASAPKTEAQAGPQNTPLKTATAGQGDSDHDDELTQPFLHLLEKNEVAKGAYLYTANCYRCHLSYAQTRQGHNMAEDRLLNTITNGKTSTQMTAFAIQFGGKLFNSEIAAIARYIRTWEQFDEPPALPERLLRPPAADPTELLPISLARFPPLHGDSEAGRRIFLAGCSRCHGPDRGGYIGPNLRQPWNTIFPELRVKSILKTGIPGSLMVGNNRRTPALSAKSLDDLLVFLTRPADDSDQQ